MYSSDILIMNFKFCNIFTCDFGLYAGKHLYLYFRKVASNDILKVEMRESITNLFYSKLELD